jgi:hypothetical protein
MHHTSLLPHVGTISDASRLWAVPVAVTVAVAVTALVVAVVQAFGPSRPAVAVCDCDGQVAR